MPELTPDRRREFLAIAGLFAVGLILRIVRLDVLPNGLFCDEASAGYDAYALLQTGQDQFGAPWPLFARSFGDYDEASYRYLAMPFVALLGLNELATRMPAALIGALTIPAMWLTARQLWGRTAGLVAALLLTLSPWHVQFSRIAFRGILLPFCLLVGVASWLHARRDGRFLWLAALALSAGLWTYSPARMLVPTLTLVLFGLFAGEFWPHARRHLLGGALLFGVVLAILSSHWLSPEGRARSAFLLAPRDTWLANLWSYFSPQFLLLNGDPNPRHHVAQGGQLDPVVALLALVGLAVGLWKRQRADWLLPAWLLLAAIPAALTEPAHALRDIGALPAWILLAARGATHVLEQAQLRLPRPNAAAIALTLALLMSAGVPLARYFGDYGAESSPHWQFGYRQALELARQRHPPCLVLSDHLFLPHIFALFYYRLPPAAYQAHPVQTVRQGSWIVTDWALGQLSVENTRKASARPEQQRCTFIVAPRDEARLDPAVRTHVERVVAPDGTLVMLVAGQ